MRHTCLKPASIILIIISFLYNIPSVFAYGDHRGRNTDSLETLLAGNPPQEPAVLVRVYEQLAMGYLNVNKDKSMEYAQAAIKLSQEKGYYKILCDMWRVMGQHHWAMDDFSRAEKDFSQALMAVDKMRGSRKYDQRSVDDALSALYGALGNLYNTMNNGALAIDYYLKALNIFEKYGWVESQAIAYYNIAELYFDMTNYDRARLYYHKSASCAQMSADTSFVCTNYQGLAKINYQQKNYELARTYVERSYNYLITNVKEEGAALVDCYILMADICLAEGEVEKAGKIIENNSRFCDSLGISSPELNNQLSLLCFKKGEWRKARDYALKSIDTKEFNPSSAIRAYRMLARASSYLGDAAGAVVFMDKEDSLASSQSNYIYFSALSEQETRFETLKKDERISLLSKTRRLYFILLIMTVVLLLAVVVAFVLRNQSHRRKKELEQKQIILDAETKERQYVAKELHDGLGGLLSLLKLKINQGDEAQSILVLNKSIDEMRRISHHLMPDSLLESGLVTALNDFILEVPGASFFSSGMDRRLSLDIEQLIYRCAFELVNNALKHSGATSINVELLRDGGMLSLSVSDNGCGFDPKQKTSGSGLNNIRERLSAYKGRLDIISAPYEGSEINLTIETGN